jgi:YtkA-like
MNQQPLVNKRGLYIRRFLFIAIALVAVSFGAMFFAMSQMSQQIPGDLDTTTTKPSANGLYEVSYQPSEEPIPIGSLQSWRLEVTTPEGERVQDATVTVAGDMPGHGHGLPTSPVITAQEDGSYLVEGLKFQMGGWWYTEFKISSPLGDDTVRFDFVLER